jgi:hypothetical protein
VKKLIATIYLLSVSGFSFSAPFGPKVTFDTMTYGRDQSGCVGEQILMKEFFRNNIDVVSGNAPYQWTCEGVTPEKAKEKRCPYSQYSKYGMDKLTCFSNSRSGYPVVCVSGATSEEVKEIYSGDEKPAMVRARFKEIFTLAENAYGTREDRSIHMDAAGCQVESVRDYDDVGLFNNGTVHITFDQCAEDFKNVLEGGYMYPGISKDKFCKKRHSKDSKSIDSHWTKLKKLNFCFQNIPNFAERYKASLEVVPSLDKGQRDAKAKSE